MCLKVRRKWTSILFGPHFPRPITDDSARSAGCFCWLVHSFPQIFSLQLAWGKARKSSRNLAPRSLSFCTPGSFVHNRYCLCELKLFVLRWEKGVAEGVRRSGRGFDSGPFTFNDKFLTVNSLCLKPAPLLRGRSNHSCLPANTSSTLYVFILRYLAASRLFRKTGGGEGEGCRGWKYLAGY